MTTAEELESIRYMVARTEPNPADGLTDVRFLLALIDKLQAQLTGQSVCDCHTWPTIQEMHDYIVALEQERDRIAAALLGLRHFTNHGGCWCNDALWRTTRSHHDHECIQAREAVATLEKGPDCPAHGPEAKKNRVQEDEMNRLRMSERRLAAITHWLEANQPDVFQRGLWDAINQSTTPD